MENQRQKDHKKRLAAATKSWQQKKFKRLAEDEITLLATRAIKNKENILGLAREFGISRQTAYRYLQYARCQGLPCAPDMDDTL